MFLSAFDSLMQTQLEKVKFSCLFLRYFYKLIQIKSPKLFFVKTTRGNQSFARRKTRGASEKSEEDFFASSPAANLVGITEEGHERFAERL